MSTQDKELKTPSSFSNDNLEVIVDELPHCLVKFNVSVNAHATEIAFLKAIKMINKEVLIPGFRKGRAPDQLIIEKYKDNIQKEFVDTVLQTAFNETVELTHIYPLRDGRIKRPIVKHCGRHEGASFSIEFERRPFIPSIDLNELHFPKSPLKSVNEEQRENAIQQILNHYTTYEPIEDRPIQENDYIDISVEILDDNPRLVIDNQRTQVNSKGLPIWLRKSVIGLSAKESFEGKTAQDPALADPTSEFVPVPFRATINAIWKGNVPAVDDELAKRIGLESVQDLQKKIDARIENENKEDSYNQDVESLTGFLLNKYALEVPQSYIDSDCETRLEKYLTDLKDKHLDPTASDYQEIKKLIQIEVIKDLKLFFLFSKFASEHSFTLTDDEVSKEFSRQLALVPSGRSKIDLSSEEKQLREHLYRIALDRKIKQYLIDQAQHS